VELSVDDFRKLCTPEKFQITLHAARRLKQRGIVLDDIVNCIMCGEIIEQYPTDYPYPSCLILGSSINQELIHVVIGSDMNYLWIITAYKPDKEKWSNDFKTRKDQ
jgi:hypothetical protein